MVEQASHHRFSYAEYLERERDTGLRHEFLDGQVFAMTGGTPEHARLIAEMTFRLRGSIDPEQCRVFSSDLRIRIPATGLATYPDVAVVCGPVEVDAEDPHAVVNPTVLVEMLSPSTEAYDRGEKWAHYRRLSSLRAYVLVAPLAARIEALLRTDVGFVSVAAQGAEALEIPSLGIRIAAGELFAAAL